MSELHTGILVAHERHLVNTRLADGRAVTMLVEDVTYLSAPHQRIIRSKNPIIRHLFVVREDDRLELHYNPGAAAHAVHGLENLALAASRLILLASTADHIRQQHRRANQPPVFDQQRLVELPGFSYHPFSQVLDGLAAARYGAQAITYGQRGLTDSTNAVDDLARWLLGQPVQGYYVVENGRLGTAPVITDPIHFHDLRAA
ncbi:hypothetical protein [Streptomyces sp. SBT349]|uniref:hypothetical protein n=1 Tax=Streptomyces sp. SBT349 TaxID=1580539 RepID=UPI00066CA19F|nr:hypothetical protein [Streptomyces sp. SBT349]